jgi:predicted secreted Zn-dependent protease
MNKKYKSRMIVLFVIVLIIILFLVISLYKNNQYIQTNSNKNVILSSSNPKTTYEEDTQYYDITGSTIPELIDQMGLYGPEDMDGIRHQANADWYVNWIYTSQQHITSCTTGPMTIETSVTYHFPNWTNRPSEQTKLRTTWDDYMIKLHTHEEKHQATAVECGKEELTFFTTLPDFPTCEKLDAYIHDKANRILEACHKQDTVYDEQTDHGRTEGLILQY